MIFTLWTLEVMQHTAGELRKEIEVKKMEEEEPREDAREDDLYDPFEDDEEELDL